MAQIMTTKEMAEYLKLHQITICKLSKEGKIPSVRIGRVWRFDREVIDEWIAKGQNKGCEGPFTGRVKLNDAVEKGKEYDLERKTLEAELNATYAALNSAANGVIITDKKGNIPYTNPALLRMFGFERERRVGGKHAAEWLAPKEGHRFDAAGHLPINHSYDDGAWGASAAGTDVGERRIMGKRDNHSFKKLQKELKRKKKAQEKLDRRQGKKDPDIDDVEQQESSDGSTG